MKHLPLPLIVVTTCLALTAGAQPSLSLASDPADLSGIGLGETIHIDVVLDGVDLGNELEFLAATLTFDETLLGSPVITPGTAGGDPLGVIPDADGFLDFTAPGIADGSFDSLFTASGTDVITDNGLFFTVELTAIGEGTGTIAFDFADALGTDATGAPIDGTDTGSPLTYTVIPEPGMMALLFVAGFGMLRRRH